MDADEFEDKLLYQTSHMKLLSRFAVASPSLSYLWKMLRMYIFKPEVIIAGLLIFIFVIYIQASDAWSRGILGRISNSLGFTRKSGKLNLLTSAAEKNSWEEKKEVCAVYAVQGRRPRMEDRFVIDENINKNTGISLFAIFDGHGGEFAADYAKDILIQNLLNKLIQTSNIVKGGKFIDNYNKDILDDIISLGCKDEKELKRTPSNISSLIQRRQSLKKSKTEDTSQLENELLNKYGGGSPQVMPKITKESLLNPIGNNKTNGVPKPKTFDAKCYIQNGNINFGQLITDEVLAADYKLVEEAKKSSNFAGTTALMAVVYRKKLTVANVGDSRGVMCDYKGNAIPLSFDHKPQQVREQKRIADAGGFIAFKGVWRVAGILATSRALGDYPLKDKNLVIAEPDILTFDLADHKPMFLILATDGLWDTFSNEEAVAYIRDHLEEPHFGAKSITIQSYNRGSVDNITVLVIVFKNGHYEIGSSS